jgi:hypothetical protein
MMAREIYEIAKEIATEAISTAHCAGYEIRPDRDLFSHSDMLELADDIADWLDRRMRPGTAEAAE